MIIKPMKVQPTEPSIYEVIKKLRAKGYQYATIAEVRMLVERIEEVEADNVMLIRAVKAAKDLRDFFKLLEKL